MSDYFKSALGYLNGGGNTNDFVGQILEINNVKIRVNRLIAEGGWALVFAVEDVATGKEYALKRLIAVDDEANKTIIQEIETLKKLSGHKNIIQYMCAQRIERDDKRTCEYLIVTEFCPGGTLADLFRSVSSTNLTLEQICKIAYQVTRAIHHLHNQQPHPIIHWDIKLENFLIANDGTIKLCDFGSASTQQIQPDSSWNAQKRANLEDQMSKFTTPMYRSPEMIDTWNNEPIGPPADCWALGCILYTLLTLRHPFPEGNKLAIVNAKYPQLPLNPRTACINELIKGCLEASPLKRMTTSMVLERLASIAETNNFDPREAVKIDIKISSPQSQPQSQSQSQPPPPPRPSQASPLHLPSRPPPPKPAVSPTPPSPPPITRTNYLHKQLNNNSQSTTIGSGGLFSSLRGGAGNLFKNIKDTSSKVIQSVQQTITRNDELDASYITSRILVMPYPDCGIEYVVSPNYIDDVRDYLKFKHPPPAKIQLYNLTKGKTNVTRLNGKHIDCNFAYTLLETNAPLLSALYQICEDIYCYLDDNFNNIIVTYCDDGCRTSATIICSLLLYCGALNSVDEAIELFKTRRCQTPLLQPSELRYINYINMLHSGLYPHTKTLVLRSIIIQPIPLFNRAKDGCRPYADIYSNGSLVYSTKRSEYDDMKLFNQHEGKICLILNDAVVCGDIMIILYHARQQLGRIIGIKMASLQFYTGYVPVHQSTMTFDYKDLDNVPEIGHSFNVSLNVMIGDDNLKISKISLPWEAKTIGIKNLHPDPLFSSTLEMEETLENFRKNNHEKLTTTTTTIKAPKRPPPPKIIHQQIDDKYEPEKEPLNPSNNDKIINDNNDDFAEADLLNLGMTNSPISTNNNKENNDNILRTDDDNNKNTNDIFGNFASFKESNVDNKQSSNDLLFDTTTTTTTTTTNKQEKKNNGNLNDFIFDPLGGNNNTTTTTTTTNNNIFGNWTNSTSTTTNIKTPNDDNFPRNSSVPNFQAQNKDPFANLAGSMSTGLNSSWNGTPKDSNTPQSSSPGTTGTPVHSSPHMQNKINIPNDINYSDMTNVFNNNIKPTSSSSATSATATKPGDIFEDLLGSQGYNFFSSRKTDKDSPKTINQMRKVEAAKTMDPEKLKVAEWTEGKKSNLRALLCSLHTVLWSDADRWQKCEMHQLVTAAEVKKAYRKACLAVHPDKQAGTDNENLAKLIFMELNNAWSTFENDATQQNLFS